MFEVKIGTPKPVTFREYSKYGDYVMDIDLDARFAGKCEDSQYLSVRSLVMDQRSTMRKKMQ